MATRRRAQKKHYRLEPVSESDVLRAADMAIQILRITGTQDLDELGRALSEPESAAASKLSIFVFDSEQLTLLSNHAKDLRLLRNKPTVALSECPVCHLVSAVAGSVTKCNLTNGCPGKPAKSSVAKRVEIPLNILAEHQSAA